MCCNKARVTRARNDHDYELKIEDNFSQSVKYENTGNKKAVQSHNLQSNALLSVRTGSYANESTHDNECANSQFVCLRVRCSWKLARRPASALRCNMQDDPICAASITSRLSICCNLSICISMDCSRISLCLSMEVLLHIAIFMCPRRSHISGK